MASPAQVTASRANAQLSTGPRSVEGKATSSRNSFKLGITAQAMIIPGEDPDALDRLTASYEQQFQPVGPVESALLQTVVRAEWMQSRYARIESSYFGSRVAALPPDTRYPLGAVMVLDAASGDTLNKIFRRQQAAQRDWNRAIESLYRLQAHRRKTEIQPAAAYAPTARAANEFPTAAPPRLRFDSAPQPAGRPTFPLDRAPEADSRPTSEPPANLALRL